jgi:HK97 gp10 family phage protein
LPDFDSNAATADLRQLSNNLASAAGAPFQPVAAQVVRAAVEAVANEAKARAPRKTGALADSIAVVFLGPLTAMVGPTKKYGVFQEFGTGTRGEFKTGMYVIRPIRASRLRFEIDGKVVFAKEVHHPGIPPHPFMRPGAQAALEQMQEQLGTSGISMVVKSGRA